MYLRSLRVKRKICHIDFNVPGGKCQYLKYELGTIKWNFDFPSWDGWFEGFKDLIPFKLK